MLLSLLLPLVWAGDWALGANHPVATKCTKTSWEYMLESVTVQEGLCVLVPCKSQYHYYGSWFRTGDPDHSSPVATKSIQKPVLKATKDRFHVFTEASNCSLDIRDAQKGDNGSYFFEATRNGGKRNYCKNQVSVHVTDLTHTPHIDIPWTLEPGHPSNLTCSVPWACQRGTPPIFSWMSSALTSLGPRTTLSSVLTLIPRPQDHGTNLTCQVTFPGADVTVEKTVQINILYAPKKLTIEVHREESTGPEVLRSDSPLQVQEGESLFLVCVADSKPPATLSWEKLTPKPIQLISHEVLLLSQVTFEDQGIYICQAQHSLGTQEVTVNLIVRRNTGARTKMAQGEIKGAGVTALLAVCLCLVYIILKNYRRKSAEKTASKNDTHLSRSSVSLVHLNACKSNNPENHSPPCVAMPISEEELELHYASFSFQDLMPRQPQDPEHANSEYSEIKTHKPHPSQ